MPRSLDQDARVERHGRLVAVAIVVAVVAVAAGVLFATGGLDRVTTEPAAARTPVATPSLRRVAVNEPVNVGEATVKVRTAVAVRDLGELIPAPADGSRFLAVAADVTVTGQTSWQGAYRVLYLRGVDGLTEDDPWPRFYRNSRRVDDLQPDLTDTVVWIFQQHEIEPVPAAVTVELRCENAIADDPATWDPAPCAIVDVPVRNLIAEATTSGSPRS